MRRCSLTVVLGFVLCGSAAFGYELKTDSTGSAVSWKQAASFVVSSDLAQALSEPLALDAVKKSVDTINGAVSAIAVSVTPGQTHGIGYDFAPGAKNQNEIGVLSDWTFDPKAIAVTIVTVDAKSHAILDADIALNTESRKFKVLSADSTADGGSLFDDIQNTLTHELGHALGLAHNPDDAEAVMYPAAHKGEISKRVLSADDLAALAFLYGGSGLSKNGEQAAGCSATGSSRFGLLPLLLGALMLFARRRPRALAAAAVSMLAVGTASASGSQRDAAPVKDAEQVATAQVLSVNTLPPAQGERVLRTEVRVKTLSCVKGSCPDETVLMVPGGKYGDIEQLIDGAELPAPGERVAYTRASRGSSPLRVYRLNRAADTVAFVEGLARAGLPFLSLSGGSTPPQK